MTSSTIPIWAYWRLTTPSTWPQLEDHSSFWEGSWLWCWQSRPRNHFELYQMWNILCIVYLNSNQLSITRNTIVIWKVNPPKMRYAENVSDTMKVIQTTASIKQQTQKSTLWLMKFVDYWRLLCWERSLSARRCACWMTNDSKTFKICEFLWKGYYLLTQWLMKRDKATWIARPIYVLVTSLAFGALCHGYS